MHRLKHSLLLCSALLSGILLGGCTDDCIYKTYTTNAGDSLCGRFCPLEDESGIVLDDNGDVVYDKPESVAPVNCTVPTTSTSSSSSSSSSTSSGTSN